MKSGDDIEEIRKKVIAFLDEIYVRLTYLNGQVFYSEEREKNHKFLVEAGWQPSRRTQYILELTPDDYFEGPTKNELYDGSEVWVFGKVLEDMLCYIKIHLLAQRNVYCISFHLAEHSMKMPLTGKTLEPWEKLKNK